MKPAFLFPGQGAQTVGMGRVLVESTPQAREVFDRAAKILGYDLLSICLNGPAEKLDSTVHSQPALFVTSLAALEWLKANKPDVYNSCQAAAGLSLGEYTALVFAGVMTFDDGLRVVQERGKAMQDASDAVSSGMVSILGLDADKIQKACDDARAEGEILQIANYLCPGNIVVSGHKGACERIADLATKAGAMKTIPLAVAGAFHTPLMQPAVERLKKALSSVTLHKPRLPVISSTCANSMLLTSNSLDLACRVEVADGELLEIRGHELTVCARAGAVLWHYLHLDFHESFRWNERPRRSVLDRVWRN